MPGGEPAAALLVSHPGHEVRIFGFVERLRPLALIVTDGSGRAAAPRTATSAQALALLGAKRSPIFGRVRDRELYAAVRRGDAGLFTGLAEETARTLADHDVGLLVSDAPEHTILAHDLTAAVADAAAALAGRLRGRAIAHYDFALHGAPDDCPAALRPRALRLELDRAGLARKQRFAARYREIAHEVAEDRTIHSDAAFAVELLRPVERPFERVRPDHPPAWQLHGKRLARDGVYPEALTFERHVAPIVGALHELARPGAACACC